MKRLLVFALALMLACLLAFGALAEEVADEVMNEEEVVTAGQVDEDIPSVDETLDDTALDKEAPATEEPVTEEPVTEEPATEEPSTEEPATEEPATEEPSTEESVTEEPVTEEPSTEEPVTEEPSTEEPVVDEGESAAEEISEISEALPALPTALELTYTGEPQELVSDPGEGTFLYSLDGENYSAEIPTATDAGEYTVYYKPAVDVEEDAEEELVEAASLTVTIAKADVTLIPPIAFNAEE